MELIDKYFPQLTVLQRERFAALYGLYQDWNAQINVVSRKDFENLYLHHVLHSLAIAKVCTFEEDARIMDIGTGGGFPGIPLAIMFPEASFTLVDSVGKKTTVARAVSEELGLANVLVLNTRAEQVPGRFDYAFTRAVADMATVMGWAWAKLGRGCRGTLPNGLLALKGGELAEELAATGKRCRVFEISGFYDEEYFKSKKVIYIPR